MLKLVGVVQCSFDVTDMNYLVHQLGDRQTVDMAALSRADFLTAAATAVILITSGGQLDLKDTFAFGRVDAESCPDSATRLPQDSSCNFVEDVFLNRMNMSWTNAVALLGAHTLGRGSIDFSGHDGI